MDIESLNKSQIILLTLLVSFVTSMATGIVTVTLMDQAPADVTRTINRVVEKTVETIVPGETKIVERVREVGATESELVVAVAKDHGDTLTLIMNGEETEHGFFVTKKGGIAASLNAKVGDKFELPVSSDSEEGSVPQLEVVAVDSNSSLSILSFVVEQSDTESNDSIFSFFSFSKDNGFAHIAPTNHKAVLGERLVLLGLEEDGTQTVNIGTVTAVKDNTASSTATIKTNIAFSGTDEGSPVFDLDGNIVGIVALNNATQSLTIVPVSVIENLLVSKTSSTKDNQTATVSDADESGTN